MNEPLVIDDYAFQNVESTDLTVVLRRKNFQGIQFRASMVIMNNDSLNHLDDYR